MKSDEIRPLTTFRAVAALLVFGSHYYALVPDFTVWSCLFSAGAVGVDMFFALSGFLFTLRYAEEVWTRRLRWRAYLKRRVARIWPLYFFVLFLSAALGRPITLINVFLIQGLFDVLWASGIAPAWSLTVEEMFYLMLPGVLMSLKNRKLFFSRVAVLGGWVFGLFGVGVLLVNLSHQTGLSNFYLLSNPAQVREMTLFGLMFDFVIGIAFGLLYKKFGAPSPRTALYLIVGAVIGMMCCYAALVWQVDKTGNVYFTPPHHGIALFAALFLYAVTQPATVVARLMSFPPLVYLGRISFAFYLVNLTPIIEFGVRFPLVMFYGIANGICVLLYQGVEKPMQRFINRRF